MFPKWPLQRWGDWPLRTRLLVPLLGLAALSAACTVIVFLAGTSRTRDGLLERQVAREAERVAAYFQRREAELLERTASLAADPEIAAALRREMDMETLNFVNARAGIVRQRFGIDLLQVFDGSGHAFANQVTERLYRVSSLVRVATPGNTLHRRVSDCPLLIAAALVPDGGGAVVGALDLRAELDRYASEHRSESVLSLLDDATGLPLAAPEEREAAPAPEGRVHVEEFPLAVGGAPLRLRVQRSAADIEEVTGAGLAVMLGGAALTLLLFGALGFVLARQIAGPVRRLAVAAGAVAAGDLSTRVASSLRDGPAPPGRSQSDEIAALGIAFDRMVQRLNRLYEDLDREVRRTSAQLDATVQLARAASESIDADAVLAVALPEIRERLALRSVAVYLDGPRGRELRAHSRAAGEEPPPALLEPDAEGADDSGGLVFAALHARGGVLGTLLVRTEEAERPDPRQRAVIEAIGALLAVPVEHGRMYEAARREVTERQRAEVALRLSEERYRRFFEEDLTGDFVAAADTSVQECNPAFAAMLGFASPSDAVGIPLERIYGEAGAQRLLARLRTDGRVVYDELELRRRDGTPLSVVQNVIGEFDAEGRPARILGYLFDNSRLRTVEQQFLQAQKMEAVGRLAGGIAHDFNNLLTVIIGYGQVLAGGLDPQDPRSAHATNIVRAGERAAGLTRQLLAFSRKQVRRLRVLELGSVLDGMQDLIRRLIGEHIELVVHAGRTGPVRADPGQLEQVVMNLVVNAREAMPTGGRLTLATADLHVAPGASPAGVELRPGRWAVLTVGDSGVGMDEATMSHIFEPFFTSKPQGTGLGLATVYGIVQQSSGHITVESRRGEGARFRVFLPHTSETPVPEVPDGEVPRVHRGSGHVLLVEDEDMVRSLVRQVLVDAGYRVTTADRGAAALEILKRNGVNFDLLLTDVVMPGMNGPALAARARQQRPELRVLYMSGYADDAIATPGLTDGGFPLVPKPLSREVLLARVEEILRSPAGEPAPASTEKTP